MATILKPYFAFNKLSYVAQYDSLDEVVSWRLKEIPVETFPINYKDLKEIEEDLFSDVAFWNQFQ